MNGKPLPPAKGYPVRLIAPGVYGCRAVKWLDRITIQHTESHNFYQQRDYKILPPEAVDSATAAPYWSITPAMAETAINSVIATPASGATVPVSASGTIEVRGYAVPQGDQGPVIRVEVCVSVNENEDEASEMWIDAELLKAPLPPPPPKSGGSSSSSSGKWCWALWRAEVAVERGSTVSIFSRATDAGGNTQPKVCKWKLRGVGYNGDGRALGV